MAAGVMLRRGPAESWLRWWERPERRLGGQECRLAGRMQGQERMLSVESGSYALEIIAHTEADLQGPW